MEIIPTKGDFKRRITYIHNLVEKEGMTMSRILLYGGTLLAAGLLPYIASYWFGAEWLFGIVTVGLFAMFLMGWERWGRSGGGLIIVTVFFLITLNSIFFVQYLPAFICSLLMGILLIPHYRKQPDGVMASMVFTLLNMLIAIEFVPNEWMLWLIVLATGGAALIGFRLNYRLLKFCFGTLFGISAFFLLLFQLVEPMPLLTVLAFSIITVILISIYRLKPARQT